MRLFSPRQVAQTILDGFATYRHQFVKITLGAPERFTQQQWAEAQAQRLSDRAVWNVGQRCCGYLALASGQ